MVTNEVLGEKPLTMVEMKEELQKIKKRDGELNFRANKTEDYLNHFIKLSAKKSEELFEEITKLDIPRLKEAHIVKIVDLIPSDIDQIKAVLQGYVLSVSDDNLKKILNVLKTSS